MLALALLLAYQVAGQAYLAPANLGWNVDNNSHAHPHRYDTSDHYQGPPVGHHESQSKDDDFVPVIPGLNPNLAPWLQTRRPHVHHRGIGHLDKQGDTIWDDGAEKQGDLKPDEQPSNEEAATASTAESASQAESSESSKPAVTLESSVVASDGYGDVPPIAATSTVSEGGEVVIVTVSETSPITVIAPVPMPTDPSESDDGLMDPFAPRRGEKGGRANPIILTTTWTVVASGAIQTHTLQRTVQPADTKFRSCIFGCTSITHQETVVTVLPLRLPCSLVSCPPCPSCVSSTVKVSVCPFISTVHPKGYSLTTTLSNGPTITIVRSTVTRTACTATRTITTRDCAQCSLTATSSASIETSGASMEELEQALLMFAAQPPKSASRYAFTVTQTITADTITTVTTTLMPVQTAMTNGVCSTFVVCNPQAFTCPSQATGMPQLAPIIQALVDGQAEKAAVAGWPRPRSPNGAFLDAGAGEKHLDDGMALVGGFAAGALGPDGIFHRAIDAKLVGAKELSTAIIATSTPTSSQSVVYVTVTATGNDKALKEKKKGVGVKGNAANNSISSIILAVGISLLHAYFFL